MNKAKKYPRKILTRHAPAAAIPGNDTQDQHTHTPTASSSFLRSYLSAAVSTLLNSILRTTAVLQDSTTTYYRYYGPHSEPLDCLRAAGCSERNRAWGSGEISYVHVTCYYSTAAILYMPRKLFGTRRTHLTASIAMAAAAALYPKPAVPTRTSSCAHIPPCGC